MKYFFQVFLLGFFVAALANSNLTSKPAAKSDNQTKKSAQCNVNNNYNTFFAGPKCKKIETMFSELKQQLAGLKKEIMTMKGNKSDEKGMLEYFM